ncbi:glucose 1-dehydrogenase [Paraburkholderia sp. GAS334]|uniref:glucose 1-dehydrogenase n=1 Tax=Paraburkholderia sp. GAS334 TaxID=3035131 RepID=UPI003D2487BA
MSKIAIVTGASRGIGASIAKRLARDGMTVVVNYSNRVEEAAEVVAEIAAAGGKAIAVKADVSSAKSVREMFDMVETQLGKVDVLVNNAGVMPALKPLAEHDDDTFDRVIAINLKGSFNTMREAATRLSNGGRIVNFSSSVTGLAFPGYTVYAATKSAIETMTNILAKEMRGRNITVNAVAPGPTGTDLFLTGKSPEAIEKLAKAAPLERLGTPDDIAAAVAFLAGPDGSWINGQTLRANGGII